MKHPRDKLNPQPPVATETDLRQMRTAIDLARDAARLGETPVAAVVYDTKTGASLAQAYNRRHLDADPTAHAEILALRQAARAIGDWRLNDCTLVVTLEPCAMCAGAIVNARIGRLVIGALDPKAGAVHSLYKLCQDRRLNHRVEPVLGVLAEECGDLLRAFFADRRRAQTG